MSRLSPIAVFLASAAAASAQWTVTNLNPAGAWRSEAMGVGGGAVVGRTWFGGELTPHAGLWSLANPVWADLSGTGQQYCMAFGSIAGTQAGESAGSAYNAAIWHGTPASWVNLNPAGASGSMALSIAGSQQAGYATFGGVAQAGFWTGTAASWVSLHPAGASDSQAWTTSGTQQAGYATIAGVHHASLWSGTAAAWQNLDPADPSEVNSMTSTQQGGYSVRAGDYHACLWSGSAASFVDLNPAGLSYSICYGVTSGYQVGEATVGAVNHACLWTGSAASFVDLHPFVPGSFSSTHAQAVWSDGTYLYVVGNGTNNATGNIEALLWKRPLAAACYANCDSSTTAPVLNVNDFLCFQTRFAAGNSYANCDASTTPPILNVNDFLCFQQRFAAGCP